MDEVPAAGSLPLDSSAPAGGARDEVGQLETRGIDYIPRRERNSHPRHLTWAMFGPQFGFGNMVFGSLPVAFGLSWWSSVAAITLGVIVGSIVFAGVCFQSPRTGTNNAVSSGAFFGVTGRYLGSAISLFVGLGFFAILVWTSGQTVVAVFHRLFSTSQGKGALTVAMIAVSVISCALAIYGHATLVASFKLIALSSAGVSILAVIVLHNKFHAVSGGNYLLGSFWSTWVLGFVLAASLPISWGPFIGDYGRYIPEGDNPWAEAVAGFAGIFLGCLIAELIGAYAQTTFADPLTPFATGFPQVAPLWLAVLLMLTAGGAANIESAAMSVYNSALDLHAVIWKVTRAQLTVVMSVIGIVVAYIALIGYDAIGSIEAFVTIMLVTLTPWMLIMAIGHIHRGGRYYTLDLQAFAIPGRNGVYHFWNGFNPRAFIPWGVGTFIGIMFSETSIYTGPMPKHVNGVDLSFVTAGIIGAVLYYIAIKVWPEEGVTPGVGERSPAVIGMAE